MAHPEVVVEPVSASNPRVQELINALTVELAGAGYAAEETFGYTFEQLAQGRVHLVGALRNGDVVGIAGIELQPPGAAELKRFYVVPELRGTGVADALVHSLLVYASTHDAPVVRLETGDRQLAAMAFYRRHEFVDIPRFGPYVSSQASVCMQRTLAERVEILLLPGSLRRGSTNAAVLRTAAAVAPPDVGTRLYEEAGTLPHFNPDDDPDGGPVHVSVAALRCAVRSADAILICTPEYAGALPGSFKNVLEWTVGDGCTYGKPVAWINASSPAAPTGGADAHESLRKVLGYVGADIVQDALLRLPVSRDAVDATGTIADSDIRQRIGLALDALAARARARRRDDET